MNRQILVDGALNGNAQDQANLTADQGHILSYDQAGNRTSDTKFGRTSITVQVSVFAERYRSQGQYVKVTEATLTYVAIDEQGRPREIPKPVA